VSANVHAPASKPRSRRRVASAALLAASVLLALAGCGSSKSSSTTNATTESSTTPQTTSTTAPSSPGAAGEKLSLEANKEGQLEYTTKSLTAKAGAVTIAFTNNASIEHDVQVESSSGQRVGGVEPFSGGTKNVTLNLKPGTYKFFCSVPGHRQAGMEGTLTVK
jgi:plastocyanin